MPATLEDLPVELIIIIFENVAGRDRFTITTKRLPKGRIESVKERQDFGFSSTLTIAFSSTFLKPIYRSVLRQHVLQNSANTLVRANVHNLNFNNLKKFVTALSESTAPVSVAIRHYMDTKLDADSPGVEKWTKLADQKGLRCTHTIRAVEQTPDYWRLVQTKVKLGELYDGVTGDRRAFLKGWQALFDKRLREHRRRDFARYPIDDDEYPEDEQAADDESIASTEYGEQMEDEEQFGDEEKFGDDQSAEDERIKDEPIEGDEYIKNEPIEDDEQVVDVGQAMEMELDEGDEQGQGYMGNEEFTDDEEYTDDEEDVGEQDAMWLLF